MTTKAKDNPWFLEKTYIRQGMRFVVGVDEVGRGPLVGSVVACAASLLSEKCSWRNEEKKMWGYIRDSKTLSELKREALYDFIQERFVLGVGSVSSETIDRINILQATFLAMKKAISDWKRKMMALKKGEGIEEIERIMFLVDGNMIIPNITLSQKAVERGDSFIKSISAASIVAKVVRDREMKELDKKYPQYGFLRHKGYGTREHMEALQKFGPIKDHRKSFAPVRKCLDELRKYGADV